MHNNGACKNKSYAKGYSENTLRDVSYRTHVTRVVNVVTKLDLFGKIIECIAKVRALLSRCRQLHWGLASSTVQFHGAL